MLSTYFILIILTWKLNNIYKLLMVVLLREPNKASAIINGVEIGILLVLLDTPKLLHLIFGM